MGFRAEGSFSGIFDDYYIKKAVRLKKVNAPPIGRRKKEIVSSTAFCDNEVR